MSYTPPSGYTGLSIALTGGYTPPAGMTGLAIDLNAGSGPAGLTASSAITLPALISSAYATVAPAGLAQLTAVAAAAIGAASTAAAKVRTTLSGAVGITLTSVAQAVHAPARLTGAAVLARFSSASAAVVTPLTAPNLPTAMNPLKFNLVIDQGATFERTLMWKAGTPAGPVIFTGCTARAQLRENIEDTTTLLELTTENGRLSLGSTDGKLTITIAAVDTAKLPENGGVYDLELVYPDGRVRRLMQGLVVVRPEVTR